MRFKVGDVVYSAVGDRLKSVTITAVIETIVHDRPFYDIIDSDGFASGSTLTDYRPTILDALKRWLDICEWHVVRRREDVKEAIAIVDKWEELTVAAKQSISTYEQPSKQ